jgi:hypothetical protein
VKRGEGRKRGIEIVGWKGVEGRKRGIRMVGWKGV